MRQLAAASLDGAEFNRPVHLWSGSGKYLYATCSNQNGPVAVWDVAAEKVVHLLGGHTAPVRDMHLHPSKGELLATCGFDKTVRIWSPDAIEAAVAAPSPDAPCADASEEPAEAAVAEAEEQAVPDVRRLEL